MTGASESSGSTARKLAVSEKSAGPFRVQYRGPLESCNFACPYCPFAKRAERVDAARADRAALARFVDWVERRPPPTGFDSYEIFFTPWGEALHRRRYQLAINQLASLSHVSMVAAQTNLSIDPRWLADGSKVALWATWHPSEMSLDVFVAHVRTARVQGATVSAGIVAVREHLADVPRLRAAVPDELYVWINAFKRGYRTPHHYYRDAEVELFSRIDPRFLEDLRPHHSAGLPCTAGEAAIAVDGDGTVRRCHFVAAPLGNLYRDDLTAMLRARPCPRRECNCYIGYAHLDSGPGGTAPLARLAAINR